MFICWMLQNHFNPLKFLPLIKNLPDMCLAFRKSLTTQLAVQGIISWSNAIQNFLHAYLILDWENKLSTTYEKSNNIMIIYRDFLLIKISSFKNAVLKRPQTHLENDCVSSNNLVGIHAAFSTCPSCTMVLPRPFSRGAAPRYFWTRII